MATVMASVVRGQAVVPELLPDLDRPAGAARPLSGSLADQLRGLLHAVVTDGSGSFLQALQPPEVLAKTGTAEYGTAKGGGSLPTHAWMIGAQGDLAVAVFVDTGASGSRTAGPILEGFLRAARAGS
jgi:cell division protein FtsI/penicillin-binding protein 2